MIEVRATEGPNELEGAVGQDIKSFDVWFQSLSNDPLVRSEVAILKTYLYWKLRAPAASVKG